MATIEVNLKEGDEEPEQHLDEGEFIERVVVPLDQLYEKLQGTSYFLALSQFFLIPSLRCERGSTTSSSPQPMLYQNESTPNAKTKEQSPIRVTLHRILKRRRHDR